VGVDLETNKFLHVIVVTNVGDNEERAKLVEMLGDWLGLVCSRIKYCRGWEEEMKLQVLWMLRGCHFHNCDYKFDKENKFVTLDVLQSFHNKPLSKKPEKRLINIRAQDTNSMKHF
jgi:hypothetical protein